MFWPKRGVIELGTTIQRSARGTMFGMMLSGDKELDRALAVIAKTYSRKFMIDALKISSKPFVKEARANVAEQTGKLKRSIKARAVRRLKRLAAVKVGPGKDEFYGMFLEFGTAHHSARPWMRPAWAGKRREVLAGITAAFATVLNRVAKRINRKLAKGKKLSRMELRLLGV